MNFKKILSVIITVAMLLSSVSVFANTEYPTACAITELEDLNVMAVSAEDAFDNKYDDNHAEKLALDFGVKFEATDDDAGEFANYIVDFELSFDKDVTAILAGQYESFGANWVAVKASEYSENVIAGLNADIDGIEFKANKPVMVMYDSGLDDQFTYEEAVALGTFNCGIKYAYDVPNGVVANLSLCVYPSIEVTVDDDYDFVKDGVYYQIDRDSKYVVDTVSYKYDNNALDMTEVTTDENIVEALNNNVDTIANAADAKGAAKIIAALAPEAKAEIAPEVIKAMVEAAGEEVETDDLKVFGNDANGTITVTADEAVNAEDAFANYEDVYEITAECSVNGVVDTVDVPVLVAIPVADSSLVEKVLHLHDGVVEEIAFIAGNGVIYVQMSKFSQIALVTTAVLANDEAELKFVARNDAPNNEAWFDLVLSGASTEVVKGFLAGKFTLKPEGVSASYSYELIAADDEIDITYNAKADGAREYLVNLDSFDKNTSYTVVADGVTEITLAKLVVTANGTGMINFADVQLNRFDYDNTAENLKEAINVTKVTGAMFDIDAPTQLLTIEIDFNHEAVTDNAAAYQNMWLEISGAGIDGVETISLGNDNGLVTVADNKYVVEKTVLANTEYFVALKGAGYRTANYPINLGEEDRTIKFWNNYKDNAVNMEFIGANGVGEAYNYNFLAGDIVMDNTINIYDLSAVVSYFGETGLVGTNNAYAKYDLNRDGNIDAIDVAILLTSWNK